MLLRKKEAEREKMKAVIYVLILLVAVWGGFLLWQKKAEEKREVRAQEQQQAEEKKGAEDKQREALMTFANGMRQHCDTRVKELESGLAELRAVFKQVSDITSKIMEEKDSRGGNAKYEVKILHVIDNADLNALALKYLGSDFSGMRGEFCERVREARAAEERYASAVKEVDTAYAETMEMAGAWGKMSAEQRKAEMTRLRNELSQLEARRDKELKEYKSLPKMQLRGTALKDDRRDKETVLSARISETEGLITKKRMQIDSLQSPDEASRIVASAVEKTQSEQFRATTRRQYAMYDIDRRLKPKVSLVDVISEYETKSIGRLRSTLSDKIAAAEKEVKAQTDRLVVIDEFILAIPVTEVRELMQRKSKLESKRDR